MRESDFWDIYRDSQDRITVSEDMKNEIVKHVRCETTDRTSCADESHTPRDGQASRPHRTAVVAGDRRSTVGKRPRKLGRIIAPIAACVALVAVLVGALGFTSGTTGNTTDPTDFSVQAYAAATDSILAMGNENQIIFSRDAAINGIGDKAAYLATEGCYTGCLFRVEGDGITRIQASISTGVIYRYTTEELTQGENPERMEELVRWKPAARGIGAYYGGYDFVGGKGSVDDLPKDDPAKKWTVGLTKKLGSTIDIPVDADTTDQSFGFWTDEDYGEPADGFSDLDRVIDLFDGETLTITVAFDDGHTTTQVIELHAADVKASLEQNAEGYWIVKLTPEIVDPTGLEQYRDYVHTLYGVVRETNHDGFPGSLDAANEFENVVSAPQGFERQPLTRPLQITSGDTTIHATIDPNDIHPATESTPIPAGEGASYAVANVSILSRTRTLPDGITLDDLRSGFGSWEYFNRVVSQIDGYELDGNGTPSDGFSWVMLQADITNTGESAGDMTGDGGHYGSFAVYDSERRVSTALARSFALENGGWDTSLPAGIVGGDMRFAPEETRTVRWLAIVPDTVLDDPTLFFLTGTESSLQGLALPPLA